MINVIFWIGTGALCGWIGYLAARSTEEDHIKPYLMVGIAGGLFGGILATTLGFSQNIQRVDPTSIFNAIMVSSLAIALLVIYLVFFGNTSSN